ncbi:uncharacterized protein yc1106_04936 [Curvularia clavata]|uniref:Uncharacterized protein n=1 Tax=Curvularia clavata TaxID=95742 RepID=A0A9Q9DSF9_CURCL|nr:uncharacterized protein yc1106_04936 [Curvularia clavata]
MAGYGNRTAPDYSKTDLEPEFTNTRLGLTDSHTAYHNPHEKHGSGTTSGAGFGNKRSSFTSSSSSSSPPSDLHLTSSTTPYSNPGRLGSGSTAGAGYGNKTGEMGGSGVHGVLGKAVEKVGGVVGSGKAVRMGRGIKGEKEDDEGVGRDGE